MTEFKDPGLTDTQGRPAVVQVRATAWGGFMLHVPEEAVFDAGAWKRFLSWMVGI